MTTLEELKQAQLEAQKHLQELSSRINDFEQKQKEIKSSRWKPTYEEDYWVITPSGDVKKDVWLHYVIDRGRYAVGNCFKTKEEAEFKLEKDKVLTELSEYARDFDKSDRNWYFYWSCDSEKIGYSLNYMHKYPTLYFPSEEIARQAIETVGKDRVKKYYLGVK